MFFPSPFRGEGQGEGGFPSKNPFSQTPPPFVPPSRGGRKKKGISLVRGGRKK